MVLNNKIGFGLDCYYLYYYDGRLFAHLLVLIILFTYFAL